MMELIGWLFIALMLAGYTIWCTAKLIIYLWKDFLREEPPKPPGPTPEEVLENVKRFRKMMQGGW